jgi:hypothetical protein
MNSKRWNQREEAVLDKFFMTFLIVTDIHKKWISPTVKIVKREGPGPLAPLCFFLDRIGEIKTMISSHPIVISSFEILDFVFPTIVSRAAGVRGICQ